MSLSGIASKWRVILQIAVSKYVCSSLAGRGLRGLGERGRSVHQEWYTSVGGNVVSVNFRPLARYTSSGSVSDINVNFWPNKALRNEFLRGLNTWVRQTVQ